MNQKGFLLASTVVKIVIAVICIVFLAYLLSTIYFNKVNAQRKIEAMNTLTGTGKIEQAINNVHNLIALSQDVQIFVPKGWYLFSFTGKNIKPNSCGGINCVCICDNAWFGYIIKTEQQRQIEKCDETGACLASQYLSDFTKELEIELGPGKQVRVQKIQGVREDVTILEN